MKIFVLLSRFPYPLEKGDKLRAFYQLKELSNSHEIFLYCLTDKAIENAHLLEVKRFCSEIIIFKLSKPLLYWNTFKQFFTEKPFQVGYFFQAKAKKDIHQKIATFKPDHIYCQLIRTSEYVKDIYTIPKTLDYMDALGKGMLRRAKNSKGIRSFLFKKEGQRLTSYENRIFDYFNHHTIISQQDKKYISHPENDKITVIENGISADFFEKKSSELESVELIFVGNMNYPPNIACAQFIVEEIRPLLITAIPELKILLSGANPSNEVKQLAQKNIEVSGWVEDIRSSYGRGKIFVAPLFIGTGLQNKLLEAMAQDIPCITTTLANNALKAEENKEILIANSAKEFAAAIFSLLENTDLSEALSKNGKKYVEQNFSWERSVEKLNEVITGNR